jgi:hypothetical protein
VENSNDIIIVAKRIKYLYTTQKANLNKRFTFLSQQLNYNHKKKEAKLSLRSALMWTTLLPNLKQEIKCVSDKNHSMSPVCASVQLRRYAYASVTLKASKQEIMSFCGNKNFVACICRSKFAIEIHCKVQTSMQNILVIYRPRD